MSVDHSEARNDPDPIRVLCRVIVSGTDWQRIAAGEADPAEAVEYGLRALPLESRRALAGWLVPEDEEQEAGMLTVRVDALASILESETWDSPSPLASEALRLIYEFDHGDWTERELQERLRRLIEPRPMGIVFGVAIIRPHFAEQAAGIAMDPSGPAANHAPRLALVHPSRSEPRSGIGIGGTPPALAR